MGSARRRPERKWLQRVYMIFIGGIDRRCDEKLILAQLGRFGVIVDVFIPKKIGAGRGFAFVSFKQKQDAEALVNGKHDLVLGARRVSVAWARSPLVSRSFRQDADVALVRSTGSARNHGSSSSRAKDKEVYPSVSHSFRDVLLGHKDLVQPSVRALSAPPSLAEVGLVKFSYMERGTRDWMDRSVVGLRKTGFELPFIRERLSWNETDIYIFLVGSAYCYTFLFLM